MIRTLKTCLLAAVVLLPGEDLVHAQVPAAQTRQPAPLAQQAQPVQRPTMVFDETQAAHEVREQLERLLRQYPPELGEVLQRDPSLLGNPEYLKPYPALVEFLAQHPEVPRNPSFFFGTFQYRERDPRERAYDMLGIVLGALGATAVGVTVVSLLVWIIRSLIDHRRWLRLSRVQTDVHTKLMDRLTNNEDLLAYIQSAAGRRFLESAPIALDGEPRPASAPLGRILWSLQAGIVLIALGLGFWFAQRNVFPEIAEGFHVVGVIIVALGAGFAVSGVAAYLISTRLGLMGTSRATDVP
jgi:hypothetical protein